MDDSTNPRARAIAALAEMFLDLAFGPEDFAAIESKAIDLGHGCMAEALGLALEAYDARLMGGRSRGLRAHPRHRDRRRLLLHQALYLAIGKSTLGDADVFRTKALILLD